MGKSAEKNSRIIEEFYSRFGTIYNFVYGKLLFNEGRRVAIELLELRPGMKVLEVGVGTGLTLPMYPSTSNVVGIDISASMLRQARQLISEQKINNAEVALMNASELKFKDNTFDCVLGNLFISATSYPVESLHEMKRVCKPNGIIVLMNHFQSENKVVASMERAFNPVASMIGFTSALEMKPLLKRVGGLKVKHKRKVNLFNMWTAVSLINEK